MNIPIMRKIDRYTGIAAVTIQGLLRGRRELPKKPKRILIIKLFGFGNFIFLAPTVKAIRKIYPGAKIDVLTYRQNEEICRLYPGLYDRVHAIRFSVGSMAAQIPLFCARSFGRYDLAIDFEQFVRLSAIIGGFCQPKYFMGVATRNSGKARAFDTMINYPEKRHIVEEYYEAAKYLAKSLGKRIDDSPKLIAPEATGTARVKRLLQKAGRRAMIGVCPGGRADDAERRYPREKLARALELLLGKKPETAIFLVGSKSEKKDIEFIISKMPKGSCIDASGLSLGESAALVSRMRAFVSNDTGPLHLAASLGVHCIGLFGPSKEWIYGPYTDKKTILRDRAHRPIRSNHNEKNLGWPQEWWPRPADVASGIARVG